MIKYLFVILIVFAIIASYPISNYEEQIIQVIIKDIFLIISTIIASKKYGVSIIVFVLYTILLVNDVISEDVCRMFKLYMIYLAITRYLLTGFAVIAFIIFGYDNKNSEENLSNKMLLKYFIVSLSFIGCLVSIAAYPIILFYKVIIFICLSFLFGFLLWKSLDENNNYYFGIIKKKTEIKIEEVPFVEINIDDMFKKDIKITKPKNHLEITTQDDFDKQFINQNE